MCNLKKIEKERLDTLLVTRGFFATREKAKRAIMAGEILVEDEKINKVGQKIKTDSNISILKKEFDYVSRGGKKLEKALKIFNVVVNSKKVIDIGASTGGFTDCLLRFGADKVYCVDVGYGQLAWKLQQDQRVVVMDRTNIRYITADKFNSLFDLATIDVSFISLDKVLPVVYNILKKEGETIALIKPQFEAGRELIQKGGLVQKPEIHQMVISKVIDTSERLGFEVRGITFSPLKGASGNIEYLIYLIKNLKDDYSINFLYLINETVERAHRELL